MKKTLLAVATLALVAQASAGDIDKLAAPGASAAATQGVKPNSPPAVQVNSATPSLPLQATTPSKAAEVSANAANSPTINPFTGGSTNAETLQRELEHSKNTTLLLEEQLKQANVMADLANVPLKKRAEIASLKGFDSASTSAAPPKAVVVVKSAVKPSVKKEKVKAKSNSNAIEMVTTPQAAAPQPSVTLEGVIVNDGTASAVLNVGGNTSIVSNGGSTPYGKLQVTGESSVRIGSMNLAVHDSTIARVKISDPKPVDPKAPVLASVPMASPVSATLPGQQGKMPSLPPIPLPPAR